MLQLKLYARNYFSPISWSCRIDIKIFFDWAMSCNGLTIMKKLSVKWVNPVMPNLLGLKLFMPILCHLSEDMVSFIHLTNGMSF